MNLELNMKDINKILAKAHFKCNSFLNDAKKQHIFAEKCRYEAVGSLPVKFSSFSHESYLIILRNKFTINYS